MPLAPPSPRRLAACALVVAALAAASSARASEYRPIDDFQEVATVADLYAQQYGPEHVLVVVDIDNTILANDQVLGSEQWFDWQEYLIGHQPDSKQLVAKDMPGLIQASGLLYTLGHMHPVQKNLPGIIKQIQARGISTIVLTSRGDEFRTATERELERNEYEFAKSALPVHDPGADTYLPYDPADPAKSGLTTDEVTSWELQKPRPVGYRNGIMMTSGQHKGAMLVTLLHRSDRDIKAVVFADNRPDNDGGVYAACSARKIEVATLIYRAEDGEIKEFQYSDKTNVTRRWKRLNRTLESVFSDGSDEK